MQVNVSGRRTTVSEGLKNQAIDKIGRLDKYLSGLDMAEVHFWEERVASRDSREFCEVTLQGHGHHIRTKVSAPDGFTAIDLAVDKLERQLRKLKTKINKQSKSRKKIELSDELVPETLLEVPPVEYNIVKNKKFELDSMRPNEAALQMDMLNHSFYMFSNSETGNTAVVYRRDDGDIGIIDSVG